MNYPEECLGGRDADEVGGCGSALCPLPGGARMMMVMGESAWWLHLQGVSALPHALSARATMEPGSTGLAGLSRGTGRGQKSVYPCAPGSRVRVRDRARGQEGTGWSGLRSNCL